MQSPALFALLGSVSLLIAVVHRLSLEWYLYFVYPWLDIPMHILGGVAIGMLFLVLHTIVPRYARFNTWTGMIIFVVVVGVIWEWFELANGISSLEVAGFVSDTLLDLCMDICGGIIGYGVGKRVATL